MTWELICMRSGTSYFNSAGTYVIPGIKANLNIHFIRELIIGNLANGYKQVSYDQMLLTIDSNGQ